MWLLFNYLMSLGGPSVPTSLTVVDAIPINDHDSSLDLDLSLPSITKKRSKRTSPISKAKEEFVPAKGQKTAAARFNKLKSKHQHVGGILCDMR